MIQDICKSGKVVEQARRLSGEPCEIQGVSTNPARNLTGETSVPLAFATVSIRVVLPFHLRNLARVEGEVELEISAPATIAKILDALEERFPALRGTIRDHGTLKRRPFVRFFVSKEDWSAAAQDAVLPEAVASGAEPFLIVGAMAGG